MSKLNHITLRDNTKLIDTNFKAIQPALAKLFADQWKKGSIPAKWDGHTAERIVNVLLDLRN